MRPACLHLPVVRALACSRSCRRPQRCVGVRRLARRALWRKRKLWVHARENKAAVCIQSAIRIYLARKQVQRQRALASYLKFCKIMRPGKAGLTPAQLEEYAAITMQGAWRRRQAYMMSKRMKGSAAYYKRLQNKTGGKKFTMEELDDMAATKMQAMWKGKQARRKKAKMFGDKEKTGRQAAAIKIQKVMRGWLARKRIKRHQNEMKMKRLGNFLHQSCFLKCWLMWVKHTDEAAHFKEVVGRTLGRWLNMGLVRGFNAMRMYAEHKQSKRTHVHNAALLAVKREMDPAMRIWEYWADYMDDLRELWSKVGEKCGNFLHMLTGNFVKLAFLEWKDMMFKNLKAKKRRKQFGLYTAWRAYTTWLRQLKQFRSIQEQIKIKWRNILTREQFYQYKDCIDERLYNRSLVGDAILMWQNKHIIHPFRSLWEHALQQIHYRKTVAQFRRRYELRGVMPIARAWQEIAHERAQRKRTVKQAVFELYKRLIIGCMQTWINIIKDRKIAEREMAAKGSKTLMRIAKRPMVRCFEAYKEYYEKERRNRQIVARIAYRWNNACVVLAFNNWITFVDMAIEERREALRDAVMDAMQRGQLATLLRTAKQQARKYQRHNLEDVMKEVLEEERGRVHSLVGAQGSLARPKQPNPQSLNGSALMPKQKEAKKRRVATWASPPKGRPGELAHRGERVMPDPNDFSGINTFGGANSVPIPAFEEGGSESLVSSKKSVRQILPAYLRSGTLPAGPKRGGGGVAFNVSESIDANGPGGEYRESIQNAMEMSAPSDVDAVQALDVGDMTAYPLLGFDAELPTRSSETVKQSLGIFEQSTKRDIKQKRSVLPPIHAAKPPPPQIDDSQDVATGLTGTVKDARPDVTLPPVVPAAISMPVIIDD